MTSGIKIAFWSSDHVGCLAQHPCANHLLFMSKFNRRHRQILLRRSRWSAVRYLCWQSESRRTCIPMVLLSTNLSFALRPLGPVTILCPPGQDSEVHGCAELIKWAVTRSMQHANYMMFAVDMTKTAKQNKNKKAYNLDLYDLNKIYLI